jgi:hypothetical protein
VEGQKLGSRGEKVRKRFKLLWGRWVSEGVGEEILVRGREREPAM